MTDSWSARPTQVPASPQPAASTPLGDEPRPGGASAWVPAAHRRLGTVAFLLTLPVAYHCLWALGFCDTDTPVLAHSIRGCAFYGAFVTKMPQRAADVADARGAGPSPSLLRRRDARGGADGWTRSLARLADALTRSTAESSPGGAPKPPAPSSPHRRLASRCSTTTATIATVSAANSAESTSAWVSRRSS